MTATALAIRHVAFEDLGLLAPLLTEHGFTISYLDAPTAGSNWQSADDADLLIILGGPIGVEDVATYPFLQEELEVIRRRLAADRPTLGICLGAQLLAVACGGSVAPGNAAEIGYGPVTLTDAGRGSLLASLEGVPVLHWHGDVISLPEGPPPLAFTSNCNNQAFAHGPNVLALQFHLEADTRSLERWFVGHAYELAARGIDVNRLRQDADAHGSQLAASAPRIFTAWLSGLSSSAPANRLSRSP